MTTEEEYPRSACRLKRCRFNTTFDWHPRPDLQRIRDSAVSKTRDSKSVECSSRVGCSEQHVPTIYIRAPRSFAKPLPPTHHSTATRRLNAVTAIPTGLPLWVTPCHGKGVHDTPCRRLLRFIPVRNRARCRSYLTRHDVNDVPCDSTFLKNLPTKTKTSSTTIFISKHNKMK